MKIFLFFFLIVIISQNLFPVSSDDTLFVAFWNVENLFDTIDDPETDDQEFLPGGERNWTDEKLEIKLYNLARVIRSMNSGKGPDILGLSEVENKNLLERLVNNFLQDKNYKVAYRESPDERGIDNGLIYNSGILKVLSVTADTVNLPDSFTRVILQVNMTIKSGDTIRVYVNHWPSRRGGKKESEPSRISAAETLRKSFKNNHAGMYTIILGDFNDEPSDYSVASVLNALHFDCGNTTVNNGIKLLNLSYESFIKGEGSYKYKENWDMLDQIIISSAMADPVLSPGSVKYICGSFEVYKPSFILTRKGKFKGTAYPTFGSGKYLGGYSDHFPVTAKFITRKSK